MSVEVLGLLFVILFKDTAILRLGRREYWRVHIIVCLNEQLNKKVSVSLGFNQADCKRPKKEKGKMKPFQN